MTYKEIIKNKEINAYLKKGNENLGQLGYTDHSQKHCMQVAHHAEYGALLANELLKETDMTLEDRVTIVSAIGNHDESTGSPEDVISAALIIADKTDVRREEKDAYDRRGHSQRTKCVRYRHIRGRKGKCQEVTRRENA